MKLRPLFPSLREFLRWEAVFAILGALFGSRDNGLGGSE